MSHHLLSGPVEFDSQHAQVIHDAAYDYFGRRLATCAADGRIKVWEKDRYGDAWLCVGDWKGHHGSVWRLSWAHPEFGQLLASASYDRNVHVWAAPQPKGQAIAGQTPAAVAWEDKANLVDSRDAVRDVAFAPRHLGLKLALCSIDGYVRVYQCEDLVKLNYWPLTDEFEACSQGCSSVAWCPSRTYPDVPALAIGGNAGSMGIWEYDETFRKWVCAATIGAHSAGPVMDIAWAPLLGRRYHLIATCGKDCAVKIWQVSKDQSNKYEIKLLMNAPDHGAEVHKVEWNATASMLGSSGDDGKVRFWSRGDNNAWSSAGTSDA